MSKVDSPENYLIIRDTFITMTAEQNPGERMRAILTANRHSDIVNGTSSRTSETESVVSERLLSEAPANRRVNPSDVEVLREAIRRNVEIPATADIRGLVQEVGRMMGGLLDTPGTVKKVTGLTEVGSMAAQGERAVLAHLAGQTVLAVASRRNVLAAVVSRQVAEVPVKLAQVGAIQRVLDIIGDGALFAESAWERIETFLPKRGSKGGDHPIQVVRRGQDKYGMVPGTRIDLKMSPDTQTIIEPSRAAAGFAFAGGKRSYSVSESRGGHARAEARGDEHAIAMSASMDMGGAKLGGGGGVSISFSGGEMPDMDF